MEVFIMLGINSSPEAVTKIAVQMKEIAPDQVHLNTVDRPPAEDFTAAIQPAKLAELAGIFDPPADAIAEFNPNSDKQIVATETSILSMLQRRPCTIAQIVGVYGMHITETSKYLGNLMRTGQIQEKRGKKNVYYAAARIGNGDYAQA